MQRGETAWDVLYERKIYFQFQEKKGKTSGEKNKSSSKISKEKKEGTVDSGACFILCSITNKVLQILSKRVVNAKEIKIFKRINKNYAKVKLNTKHYL